MSSDVDRVAHYLKSRSLHASRPWLEGCIEYYKSEHPGRQVSIFDVQNFAFEQWLLVDLRTMGVGCLPHTLSCEKEVTLTGTYAVQVEIVKDIAIPAYSQLLEERQISTENCEFTLKKPENWEPRAGRVLKLSICDGIQQLVAMEYSPIHEINKSLIPGTKILIIGPVRCRRGILLLEQKNVIVLGGEVDTLLTVNSVENVLLRALNRPENLNPPIPQESEPEVVAVGQTVHNMSSAYQSHQRDEATVAVGRSACNVSPALPSHQRSTGRAGNYAKAPHNSDFPEDDELADLMAADDDLICKETHSNDQEVDGDVLLDDADDDFLRQLPVNELASQALGKDSQISQPSVKAAFPVFGEPIDQVMLEWPLHPSCQIVSSDPFVYIVQLTNSRPKPGVYRVKGFLLTLLSTLEQKEGRWHLLANLSDGTANLDVSFSDEVLDEIIGFSATEMNAMRQKMAGNPAIKERIKQGFEETKKKLHDLNCIFYVNFSLGKDVPVIERIEVLSPLHLSSLKSRSFE